MCIRDRRVSAHGRDAQRDGGAQHGVQDGVAVGTENTVVIEHIALSLLHIFSLLPRPLAACDIREEPCFETVGMMSVSYTHLDV